MDSASIRINSDLSSESNFTTLDANVISIQGNEINIHIKTTPEIRFLRIPKSSILTSGSAMCSVSPGDMLQLYINNKTNRYEYAIIYPVVIEDGFVINIVNESVLIRSSQDAVIYKVPRKDLEPVEAVVNINTPIKIHKRTDGSFRCIIPTESSIFMSPEQQEINSLQEKLSALEVSKNKQIEELKSALFRAAVTKDVEFKDLRDKLVIFESDKNACANQLVQMYGLFEDMLSCVTSVGSVLSASDRLIHLKGIQENIVKLTWLNSQILNTVDPYIATALRAEYSLSEKIHDSKFKDFVLNICPICNTNRDMYTLKCKNSFCRADLSAVIQNQTNGLLVFYSNEAGAVKPTCPTCSAFIEESEIKSIFGEQAFRTAEENRNGRLRQHEASVGYRFCPACNNQKSLNEFFHSHGCICQQCHVLTVLDNKPNCSICKVRLNDLLVSETKMLKLPCGNPECMQTLSLYDYKPNIQCKDHFLMCKGCEEKSYLRSKCVLCERYLKDNEKQKLHEIYGPRCVGPCNKVIDQDRAYMDKYQCSCVMCFDCYFTKLDFGIVRCNRCSNLLCDRPVVQCMMDQKEQFEDRTIRLECSHLFCKNCLLKEEKKQTKSGNPFCCPICKHPIVNEYYSAITYSS